MKECCDKKSNPAKLAIRLLIILGGGLLALVLMLTVVNLLLPEKEQPAAPEIHFYPVYEGNIFENPQYLGKDRLIRYCDDPSGYGLKSEITDADRETFDIKVRVVELYLKALMSGDNETLKELFSDRYMAEVGVPQIPQQMIYNMCIYYYRTDPLDHGVTQVTYKVDYMIYQNSGTYRRDVGSDGIKPEYLVLNVYEDGTIRIDNILR